MRTLTLAMLVGACATTAMAQDGFDERWATRQQRDRTIWSEETLAQRYEQTFVALWDHLRSTGDQLSVLADFAFDELTIGAVSAPESIGAEVERMTFGTPVTHDRASWHATIDALRDAGVEVIQSEWHHAEFVAATSAAPARSVVSFVLHARDAADQTSYDVTGKIAVEWRPFDPASTDRPTPATITLTKGQVLRRTGAPIFERVFNTVLDHVSPADDVVVIDIDLDGDSDILYPPSNTFFRNDGAMRFTRSDLCTHPTAVIAEAAVADFDGDGRLDMLVAGANPFRGEPPTNMALFLYSGDENGAFTTAKRATESRLDLPMPEAFAIGDIDGDGDLDLFIAQYLTPYIGGNFPDPYYDANDGWPAYLLLNDGNGVFTDVTETSALAKKRFRRTFRSSFIDIDADRDLDLVVVSDFAGVDVYTNDGTGAFTDVTDTMVDEWSSFGMSHTFDDFDRDGRVDLYVTGMASTTARRLEAMGAGREDRPDFDAARMRIAYGNRMYLQATPGRWAQPTWNDDVARSGWAWGCCSLDFDVDGRHDLYVTNGNLSGTSAKDYCTRFWCHDIYEGSGNDDAQAQLFGFDGKDLTTGQISWNGFEKNRLFRNDGDGFTNVAFLADVAIEADCRAAVTDDFDLDGRPDLLVVALDRRFAHARRDLQIHRNLWPTPGHWIGVRLRGGEGVSPIGATIVVSWTGGQHADAIVTGDSAKAQHAFMKHIGLGKIDAVESIEVRWPNGATTRIEDPAVDTYHLVTP